MPNDFFFGPPADLALEPHLIQPFEKQMFSLGAADELARPSPHAACMHESLRLSSDKLTCRF